MPRLLHQLLTQKANNSPSKTAITHKNNSWNYRQLAQLVEKQAQALIGVNLKPQHRTAIYLPKQIETVSSFLSVSQAAGVFVPINPVLKSAQVGHILNDCNVQILITSKLRLQSLATILQNCPDLHTIILVENEAPNAKDYPEQRILGWQDFLNHANNQALPAVIDTKMAAILYTSGSTGKPKGVVLSHHNIVAGAQSVAEYLNITEQDKLLAVLPFSFDYGLNQLTSSLLQGATCILLDYLLPRDVIKALEKHRITGLAAVPPLWSQLASLEWPDTINQHLRYMTNSGGKMPKTILDTICKKVPDSQFYLMYGLTEAFRSTYLPPEQIKQRPDSMGKAIPNAEILVVREDGSLCAPHEPGELVHKGSLVAMGYWNDPEKTAERFKLAPNKLNELPLAEIAVWSGDQVSMDEEGYLYFIGRKDDMLKTSGYRVSPTEIEEVIYSSGLIKEVAAIGIPDEALGQIILAIVSVEQAQQFDTTLLTNLCRAQLANFMIPAKIIALDELPKNPNGKIDRQQLIRQFTAY
jgi:acyl-CoA ligase (AMP-forming) (exosortase A-associated)